MPASATRLSPREILTSFSWRDSRRLRRTPRSLDLRLRLLFVLQWLVFLLLLGVSAVVLLELGPDFAAANPLAFAVLVIVAAGKHILGLVGLLGGEAHRLEEAPEDLRGALEPEEVETLVKTVARRFRRKAKPNLYVAIDQAANALAANSMLLNFIPRYNAIFLNSYLVRALTRDQLRAILVHELAHFYRYMGPFGRNAWLAVVGSIAACVAVFSTDPDMAEIPLWMVLFVLWWAPLGFMWVFLKIASLGQHDLEYACDAVAAEVIGVEPMVNALLRMGDRAELMEMVLLEIHRQTDDDRRAKVTEIADALLERVPDGPIDLAEARRALRLEAPLEEAESRSGSVFGGVRRIVKEHKALGVVRWSGFDTIRRDGQLDRQELHRYVESLVQDGHVATHDVALEHPLVGSLSTHPSTLKRIVYLYLHFVAADSER
jgi:Zn-dependent protease with chaperone function